MIVRGSCFFFLSPQFQVLDQVSKVKENVELVIEKILLVHRREESGKREGRGWTRVNLIVPLDGL